MLIRNLCSVFKALYIYALVHDKNQNSDKNKEQFFKGAGLDVLLDPQTHDVNTDKLCIGISSNCNVSILALISSFPF